MFNAFISAYFIMFRSYSYSARDASNSTSLASQASQSDDNCGTDNPIHDPVSSVLSMFIMSLNKFDETVCHFERTDHPTLTVVRRGTDHCSGTAVAL